MRAFEKTFWTLLIALSFVSASARAECSNTTNVAGVCEIPNGDRFIYTDNPECLYDLYVTASSPRDIHPKRAEVGRNEVIYMFDSRIVILPMNLVRAVTSTNIELAAKQSEVARTMDAGLARTRELESLAETARANKFEGGVVFESVPGKSDRLIGKLTCHSAAQ